MGCSITSCLNIEDILATTYQQIRELMDVEVFAAGIHQPGQEHIDFRFSLAGNACSEPFHLDMQEANHPAVQCILLQREICIHSVSGAETLEFKELQKMRLLQAESGATALPLRSALCVPLKLKNNRRGVLCLYSSNSHAYQHSDVAMLQILAGYVAVALDNAEVYLQLQKAQQQLALKHQGLENAYRSLEEVSLTDPLTGLRNRRFLQQQLDADIAITMRQHEEWKMAGSTPQAPDIDLVFFLVDIDHFKAVNDQYGHAAGDMVLIQMRDRLEKVFRESDYLVRWGGEEFLVVARATSRTKAEQLAERIRHTISGTPFALGGERYLSKTCSVGFTCFPFLPEHPGFMSWQQTVELADHGLYTAKRSGRDAWVGLHGTESTVIEDGPEQLVASVTKTLESGGLRLSSSIPLPSLQLASPAQACDELPSPCASHEDANVLPNSHLDGLPPYERRTVGRAAHSLTVPLEVIK